MAERPGGRILVIRGGAIGDFILTIPAIAALRGAFPNAYFEILGYPHIAQIAKAAGLVDKVQSIEAGALAGFFARNGSLSEDLCDYFSDFDLIVSYLYDPDEIFRTNVGRCTRAQFIKAPHRAKEDDSAHAAKVYLRPLEQLAIFDADPVPRIRIGGRPKPGGKQKMVAIHPGSGSEKKNWPEAKWSELLGMLFSTTDMDVVLAGGEAEGDKLQRLSAGLPLQRLKIAQSRPLAELAALLETCDAFVGHDSGISHLAAAVGVPGVVLWGDTVETVWRPPSEKVFILRGQKGIGELQAAEVLKNLLRLF
jgi:heptosyltransferase-2